MPHAYAVANLCTPLAAAAFTPGAGPADATRSRLNDGHMRARYNFTANASGNTLVIDFGTATTVKGVAVLNSNIASASAPTLKLDRDDNAGFTSPVEIKAASTLTTAAPAHKEHALQTNNVTAERYLRLTWAWTGTFALSVGEIFAYSAASTLARGGVYGGSGEGEELLLVSNKMLYGELRSAYFGGPVREKRLAWQDFSSAERDELQTLWRVTKGHVTPLLWLNSYEATATAAAAAEQDCLFARLMLERFDVDNLDFGRFSPPEFLLRSLGREVGA